MHILASVNVHPCFCSAINFRAASFSRAVMRVWLLSLDRGSISPRCSLWLDGFLGTPSMLSIKPFNPPAVEIGYLRLGNSSFNKEHYVHLQRNKRKQKFLLQVSPLVPRHTAPISVAYSIALLLASLTRNKSHRSISLRLSSMKRPAYGKFYTTGTLIMIISSSLRYILFAVSMPYLFHLPVANRKLLNLATTSLSIPIAIEL